MIILQHKCQNCLSVFEHIKADNIETKCIKCNSKNTIQNNELLYQPNKNFCRKSNKEPKKDINKKLSETLTYEIGRCDNYK